MKKFSQYSKSLDEAVRKPTKQEFIEVPPKGNARVESLFRKVVDPKKGGEGLVDDLVDYYAYEELESGESWHHTVSADTVEDQLGSKYIDDDEDADEEDVIDEDAIRKNRSAFKKFTKIFVETFAEQQWNNVRRDMRSSISGAYVYNSKNTAKPMKITVAEGGNHYKPGSDEITYIYVGKVDADNPDLILSSKKSLPPKEVAKTVERLLFDRAKSVKGIKF